MSRLSLNWLIVFHPLGQDCPHGIVSVQYSKGKQTVTHSLVPVSQTLAASTRNLLLIIRGILVTLLIVLAVGTVGIIGPVGVVVNYSGIE